MLNLYIFFHHCPKKKEPISLENSRNLNGIVRKITSKYTKNGIRNYLDCQLSCIRIR